MFVFVSFCTHSNMIFAVYILYAFRLIIDKAKQLVRSLYLMVVSMQKYHSLRQRASVFSYTHISIFATLSRSYLIFFRHCCSLSLVRLHSAKLSSSGISRTTLSVEYMYNCVCTHIPQMLLSYRPVCVIHPP